MTGQIRLTVVCGFAEIVILLAHTKLGQIDHHLPPALIRPQARSRINDAFLSFVGGEDNTLKGTSCKNSAQIEGEFLVTTVVTARKIYASEAAGRAGRAGACEPWLTCRNNGELEELE
jgi:hypothetical protein